MGTPIITFDEARKMNWDATMIPGAGFSAETVATFEKLCTKQFGIRVQHILNDQARRDGFLQVNRCFKPHIIIFNNYHWPPGSFTDFQADRFYFLVGAVDTERFKRVTEKNYPHVEGQWWLGGQARKNPEPLIAALRRLDSSVGLRLFGGYDSRLSEIHADLVTSGRLKLLGEIDGEALPDFYRSVDIVVMAEKIAGWSNLTAEAMASGVPVICTPPGTINIAHHERTALVMAESTPEAIAENVQRLISFKGLAGKLADAADDLIRQYSWGSYTSQLLKLIDYDGTSHYTWAPDLNLFGKWPVNDRLAGLEDILAKSEGLSVVDFGSAEGLVARAFAQHGARSVHGFELAEGRVRHATALCSGLPVNLRVGDLSNWARFKQQQPHLRDSYDIVLYLGIHHRLPRETRLSTFTDVATMAAQYLVLRMPEEIFDDDNLSDFLTAQGFREIATSAGPLTTRKIGEVRIYIKRNKGNQT